LGFLADIDLVAGALPSFARHIIRQDS
jgi:hypothetical protein